MDAKQIYAVVGNDFSDVDREIRDQLGSDVPLVEKIAEYIVDSGGKRLRPLLVLLVAQACGYQGRNHIPLAAVIEFIHTATLLHDDVVDTSDMRRGRATANHKWGNPASVLVGDFLYSRAFEMLVEIGVMDVMGILAKATNVIAEGEVLQLLNVKNPDVDQNGYMKVIQGKTATLFEASSHGAAALAGADADTRNGMSVYGMELGLAFQLIDDLLDYTGDAEELGKNVGDDLAEGKPTLPLIRAMQVGSEEQRKLIRNAIRKGGLEDMEPVLAAVKSTGALDYTFNLAEQKAALAREQLVMLPQNQYREALEALTYLAVKRSH